MKATAKAHSNIAFIKYWGRKEETLRLPSNGSISMNLSNLFTTTTVEFRSDLNKDDVLVNGEENNAINSRISKHLDRIRMLLQKNIYAKVISQNSFAASAGLASSASGFAALTVAGVAAAGLHLSEKELSILARQGSGSACRSIPDGFVEWLDGNTSEDSYAYKLFDQSYWDLCDIVTVISKEKKDVPTSTGQQTASSSIFFQTRLNNIAQKIKTCKNLIKTKNFDEFGKLIEMEALELHTIMFTSWPSLIYLEPTSLTVMKEVKKLRDEGISVYFTIDAGPNIHIICQAKDIDIVQKRINSIPEIIETIVNQPSKGTYLLEDHLF
ncbi:MAG: diphosphomevalonate decarboxylase [Candidatus Roizmanbacteria bacterium]|nr:diphosphomevalonate decarboxylase [Candidatus Roizmanbacteria bacterium]